MPKSKRQKEVSLTKVEKRTKERKEALYTEIQESADKYRYCWVFEVGTMRNTHLKTVRSLWKDSARIFFGRCAVMAKALGSSSEDEYKPGLHQIAQHIKGQVGLLFTDSPPTEVTEWFDDFAPADFARSGTTALRTVTIPSGPVLQHHSDPPEPFPHSEEPQLRKLGLHSRLVRGVPTLDAPHIVCKEGDTLTPEQTQLLKLLGEKLVNFRVSLKARWDAAEGKVEVLAAGTDSNEGDVSKKGGDDEEDASMSE